MLYSYGILFIYRNCLIYLTYFVDMANLTSLVCFVQLALLVISLFLCIMLFMFSRHHKTK